MRKIIFSILFILISGCHFHARGPLPLAPAMHDLYLESQDPYGQLTRNLKQFLKVSGVHLLQKREDANVVLIILSEVTSQQLISISGTQQTRQYNLVLNVSYQLITPQGKPLTTPQLSSETRTLTIKADQILAGSNEANALYDQMRQAVVYDIMSRLSSKDIMAQLTSNQTTSTAPLSSARPN